MSKTNMWICVLFCVHDTAANRGQCLVLSKSWQSFSYLDWVWMACIGLIFYAADKL